MKIRQLFQLIARIRRIFTTSVRHLQPNNRPTVVTERRHLLDEDEDENNPEQHKVLRMLGYTLLEKLGEGSFSIVMSAYSEKHGRDVAVKIITKRTVPRLYTEKFLPRDVDLVKNLNHRNVIRFLNVTESRKTIYVIMDLAANGNLLENIKRNTYIDEKTACRWFHHLVNGIAYCHSKGVAHRDLKCENLLLDIRNILKITDFSFARANLPQYLVDDKENINRETILSSTFCGSYAYACPEILLRKPYEPHLSDTWSMGIILYAMLYGRLPFDDTNLRTLLQDVRRPVRFLNFPAVSYGARNLIHRILSPSRIRIYIPKIRSDAWYAATYDSNLDEDYRRSMSYTGHGRWHSKDASMDEQQPSTSSYAARHKHKRTSKTDSKEFSHR